MKTTSLDNDSLLVDESIYSTANGYIGVRGSFEEGYDQTFETVRGTYINGFFENHDIKYSESAYGFPTTGETMVGVFDGQGIVIKVDGDEFNMCDGEILSMYRKLDIRKGVSYRSVHWKSPKNHELRFNFKRMTSFVMKELFSIDLEITSVNYTGEIQLISSVEKPRSITNKNKDPRVAEHKIKALTVLDWGEEKGIPYLIGGTSYSQLQVQVCCFHNLELNYQVTNESIVGDVSLLINKGEEVRFTKVLVYTDSRRHEQVHKAGMALMNQALNHGLPYFYHEQKKHLEGLWLTSDIFIEGDEVVNDALRYNMYQLYASAGKDGISQISAKGLSGIGYEGHYFWDTEIYLLPYFILTKPSLAKALLKFRFLSLEKAKVRAKELGHVKGAKIPWRTISGIECSSYFPAGTAQYHINCDLAHGVIQYYLATGDKAMIEDFGFELLLETGRLLMDTGHFDQGKFKINGVTGPDEYTAIVNNNYYTNAMTQYHFKWLSKLGMEILGNVRLKHLVDKLELDEDELMEFSKAWENMYLPSEKSKKIHLQDDGFMAKKVWDFENTPKDKYPLLLNFHPLTIYRHQVLKQADTVLAHFLLDEEDQEYVASSYDYYEKITTHDSSLSPCVYGIMASRIGQVEKAYDYFMKTIYLDIDNLHGNTKDGLHIANAGGSFLSLVYGFGGLRFTDQGLSLRPRKPKAWTSYSFSFTYRGVLIKVKIGSRITLEANQAIELRIYDKSYKIEGKLEVNYIGN